MASTIEPSDPGARLRELFREPSMRVAALRHLAPRLSAEVIVPAMYAARSSEILFSAGLRVAKPALEAIAARAVELGQPFVDSGGELAAYVPDADVPRAVELAREADRPALLAALAPRVAAGDPDAALALLRESAERSNSVEGIATELSVTATHLDAKSAGKALDLALEMSYPYAWLAPVAAMAPVLSQDDARRAFAEVMALPDDARVAVLALLAPRAGADAVDRVVFEAARLPPVARLTALTTLAEAYPDDAELVGAAETAAGAAMREYTGYDARVVMDSLVRLVGIGLPLIAQAVEFSTAPEIYDRPDALLRLARAAPPEQRRTVIDAAVEAADQESGAWRVLADLGALLPRRDAGELERRVVDAAEAILYEPERTEALRELADRFDWYDRPDLRAPVEAAPGETDAILAEVPAGQRDAVLADALWSYAGSPPAMAPPPEPPAAPSHVAPPTPAPPAAALPPEPPAAPSQAAPPPPEPPAVPSEAAPPPPAPPTQKPHNGPDPPPAEGRRHVPRPRRPVAKARRRRAPKPPRPVAKARRRRAPKPPRPAVVNTGFAEPERAGRALSSRRPLGAGRRYAFWLEVGEPVRGSIETVATALPEDLPERARLTVLLSAVQGGITVTGRATGELEVRADGSAAVVTVAEPGAEDRPDRLVFHVDVGPESGEVALRCSISYRNVVLQSRMISARVARGALRLLPRRSRALRSDLDYVLARTLDPPLLATVPEHRLSLMVNGDDGTHALQVVAGDGASTVVQDATFEGGELEDLVRQTRGALRRAAWDSEDPWTEQSRYRYAGARDSDRLRDDLIRLAVRGWRFYDACVDRLAGGFDASRQLEELTRRPARIQVATRRNASLLLPAALFYDQGFDTGLPAAQISLCPAFLQALEDGGALSDTACFKGDCPSRDDQQTVCPSGFWGYRHSLGLPLSLGDEPEAADAAVFDIHYDGAPELSVAVSTDPMFTGRTAHEEHLRALAPGLRYADTRDEAIALLRSADPGDVVYFYCHGGLTPTNVPYLSVGAKGEPGIPSDIFRAMRIRWGSPRPLVFLNGCHTTALDPGQALNFPARLVEVAAAAGVIGTEITNFEPLASAFAEECLKRFLAGEAIGDAVRAARLALLAQGNPLGLIYIPFVLPSLRLVAS